MSLIEKPNVLSLVILGLVVAIAAAFGVVTYTQRPETNHFNVDEEYTWAYDFARPDRVISLPGKLQEISGLCPAFAEGMLFAIQDEDGDLFTVDPDGGEVIDQIKFDKNRDYEGVTRNDSLVFILERDGDIFRFKYEEGVKEYNSDKLETDFSYGNETEGICYDERTGQLLIVPKERELNPAENDNRHGIYAYDFERENIIPQPVFYIDEFEVGHAVYGKSSRFNFKPSGVAVDPVTGDIYVIAAVGNLLVVITRESEIKHIELLDEKTFRQPEGITFNAAGDLFISSEGKGKDAVIATFKRQTLRREMTGDPQPADNNE